MAGGNPEEGRETGRKAFETYGQLAAQRIAPLNEVAKRCLRWRDAVAEGLRDSADELLRMLTARLRGVVRETDALGRFGGDEFIVIAEELSPTDAGPELIAERLLEALKEPFRLTGHETPITVRASIGIATGSRAS